MAREDNYEGMNRQPSYNLEQEEEAQLETNFSGPAGNPYVVQQERSRFEQVHNNMETVTSYNSSSVALEHQASSNEVNPLVEQAYNAVMATKSESEEAHEEQLDESQEQP